jgi:hypothetical protein
MAASCPLHRDGSASRQPSSHSLHGITASNAALPSRKVEGLLDHLRPWSGSRSCGRPPRPRPLPFARALRADAWTKSGACGRTVRMPPCNRICQATTMRRTAGIKNNIGTRVERREKLSNSLPPYMPLIFLPHQAGGVGGGAAAGGRRKFADSFCHVRNRGGRVGDSLCRC